MLRHSIPHCLACALATLLMWPLPRLAASAAQSATVAPAVAPLTPTEYRRKLEDYTAARRKYEGEAECVLEFVAQKRRIRNAKRRADKEVLLEDYVLAQPPVYAGPSKPVDPSAAAENEPPPQALCAGGGRFPAGRPPEHFTFVPQPPQSELEFKRAYAAVAAAAGITREQAVRIYGFESGGNGKYDVQAGLEYPGPGAHAITTALGYNQLLATNSVELLAEKGDAFLRALRTKAAGSSGEARTALEHKIAVLKSMVDFSRSVPDDWSQHDRLANTPKGLGVHAMNLDIDVGPLLQAQKLRDLRRVRARQGLWRTLERRRARDDELDRRRQRHRHGDAAGGLARPGPDRELLPARRLRAQPGRHPQQRGGQAAGRDGCEDGRGDRSCRARRIWRRCGGRSVGSVERSETPHFRVSWPDLFRPSRSGWYRLALLAEIAGTSGRLRFAGYARQ